MKGCCRQENEGVNHTINHHIHQRQHTQHQLLRIRLLRRLALHPRAQVLDILRQARPEVVIATVAPHLLVEATTIVVEETLRLSLTGIMRLQSQ